MPGVEGSDHVRPASPPGRRLRSPPGATGWSPRPPHHADVRHRRPRGPRRSARGRAQPPRDGHGERARAQGSRRLRGVGGHPRRCRPGPSPPGGRRKGRTGTPAYAAPAPGFSIRTVSSTTRRSCARRSRPPAPPHGEHRTPRPSPSPSPRGAWTRRCAASKGCSPSRPGTAQAPAPPGSGSFRREAAVLRLGRRALRSGRSSRPSGCWPVRPPIDTDAVALSYSLSCVPAPQASTTIRQAVPGQLVTFGATAAQDTARPTALLVGRPAIEEARTPTCRWVHRERIDRRGGLSDSVAARMVADVPVGALPLGRIDSSLVVALMQRHRRRPVRTFTVGSADHSFDESSRSGGGRHLPGDRPPTVRSVTRGPSSSPGCLTSGTSRSPTAPSSHPAGRRVARRG